jgi:hypothetical protein
MQRQHLRGLTSCVQNGWLMRFISVTSQQGH